MELSGAGTTMAATLSLVLVGCAGDVFTTATTTEAGIDVPDAASTAAAASDASHEASLDEDHSSTSDADAATCGPSNCSGCCDGTTCYALDKAAGQGGVSVITCGTGGQACRDCIADLKDRCVRGICSLAVDASESESGTMGCQTIAHNNGVGQSFYDCNQQGSHNQAQAQAACGAYTGSASACTPSSTCCGTSSGICLGTTAESVCGSTGNACYCWQYSGPNGGRVQSESGKCSASCGASTDPSWN